MAERKIIGGFPYIRFEGNTDIEAIGERAQRFREIMSTRRSLRDFSERPVPESVMRDIIGAAACAPSGANKQPWTFCLVSNPDLKRKIRELAEEEEKQSYAGRMSERWLKDLEPLGTNWEKPFLETAPWLIVVFKRVWEEDDQSRNNNYYVNESVGIAVGMLLTAIHHAGLVALTHTPSPMTFLQDALERPANERAFLLIPVGFAAEEAWVPDIKRKPEEEYLKRYL